MKHKKLWLTTADCSFLVGEIKIICIKAFLLSIFISKNSREVYKTD